jgi:GNAT superfamily N-acetyltransferase
MGLDVHAVTPARWPDLVDLFERPGPRGAWPRTSACYCMFWRLPPAEYEDAFRQRSLESLGGGPNKEAMSRLVAAGTVPGLLAYRDRQPVGWVSVSPREDLVRLEHVPTPGSPDGPTPEGTWSLSCFYVHRTHWRSGVGAALLAAGVERALAHDARAIDAYPVQAGSIDPYTGYDTMFAAAGFELVRPGRGRGRALWRRRISG